MFKWGINLLFVVFAEIIFCITSGKSFYGIDAFMLVLIFLTEFTIVGALIYKGYETEFKKK